MEDLAKKWLSQAERCRKSADKTYNEMTEQACLAEAHALEVCADELKRAIARLICDTIFTNEDTRKR